MKPGYIFSAVFIVALAMALGLPQLTAVSPVHAAEPAPVTAAFEPIIAEPSSVTLQSGAVVKPGAVMQPTPVAAMGTAEQAFANSPTAVPQDRIPLTSVAAPELQSFIDAVVNNQPGQVVGVYVPGVFALPILQQPANDQNFISPFDGALTQYAPPLEYGTISLLAHNYLSGRVFFNMQMGQDVILVYGDGNLSRLRITTIDYYQALSPSDPYSNFINQADASATVQSFQDVYDRYYKVNGQVVFQTCVEKNGDLSWGRIFVVARPY